MKILQPTIRLHQKSFRSATIYILASVAVGVGVFLSVRASGPLAAFEGEDGTLSGAASSRIVAGASNGKAVTFGDPSTVNSQILPFALPSQTSLKNSPKKVFAHYIPSFPISLDNKDASVDYYTKNYLNPHPISPIEAKHAEWGGFIRERPLPRPVNPSTNWKIDDMKTEVKRASEAGIDGFMVNILSTTSDNWDRLIQLIQGAQAQDPTFKIVLMPDATSTGAVADPALLAQKMASLASNPSVYHLPDGRLVIAPFAPEAKGAAYWQSWLTTMKTTYGIDVAFVPCFLNYGANAATFAPFSYGLSNWGNRSPQTNANLAANMNDAHARGKIWMQPVSTQDERPRSGLYDEAGNTENLRTTWTAAIAGADWVQIPTWNDYAEGAEMSPSTHIGWSLLDISTYFLARFKSTNYPAITKDVLYLSHRVQPHAAQPTGDQTKIMTLRPGSTPARDTVEILSFLSSPATINVTIGQAAYSYTAPAGMSTKTYPLAAGTITATAIRSGTTSAHVTSPFPVTATRAVQDLQYYFSSSSTR